MTTTLTRGVMLAAGGMMIATGGFLAGCDSGKAAVPDLATKQTRGRYLVQQVGMCADCHTPRGPGGVFDQSHWLQGAPLGFAPSVPMPVWADHAPAIAGLKNYTDEQAIALLSEGRTIHGQPLRPPMPEYRFSAEDAAAVVAYLRTLK